MKKKKKKGILKYLVVSILLIGIVIKSAWYLGNLGNPLDINSKEEKNIVIPNGASTSKIGSILVDERIINKSFDFKLFSRINKFDGKFKSGEFILSPSMSMDKISHILIEGKSTSIKFTIPEGLNILEVSDILSQKGIVNKNDFISEVENGMYNYKICESKNNNNLEGYLYPNTYFVFSNASPRDVIEKMVECLDSLIEEEDYKKADNMGYTMHEIITIASLIQKETLIAEEKPIVASVIYNRLKKNQKLQIDASVQYALEHHKSRLTYDDLKTESPYNTYLHNGLPKGPICSPDIDSIKAALYPANTNYYYYVLSPENNGKHNFSETYNEFLKNKKLYIDSL